ncbi:MULTISPECIES: DUF1508 domain-containing protein [unclassified Apibacter]|nr:MULTISPECIES: DUF1508 domain-containing protein [unclassified Apibacter]MCX8676240.1 DUF1508 domain-containing protein [Apibacter sp. B3919]MXO23710.1 DUF1508 domain-containing protein [Apibacter sp. B3924]MXO26612.1 DUF1508 domain-containing protein [Apibacter sp. B3813]MXO29479.1 DUF1508 domain-containing protein [Apibacter sp. B3913]MXO31431.1 DUF1508 domain-containing protein [Apibacter sp. B3912]
MIYPRNNKKFYFEIDKNEDNLFYFQLKDEEGNIYLERGAYTYKTNCKHGIKSVIRNSKNRERFIIKQASNKKWTCSLTAGNGRAIAFTPYFKTKFRIEKFVEDLPRKVHLAKFSDKTKRIPQWTINN